MSAFNEARYLPQAVNSVRRQRCDNWELILFDDASTDGTADWVKSLADPRIHLVRNQRTLGLTTNLRRGVEMAAGQYIARLDADDVALPERFETQVHFLEQHRNVCLLGSACYLIDEAGRYLGTRRLPEGATEISWSLLWGNPFVHSTVMLRRESLVRSNLNYDDAFQTAQDYDLWSRVATLGPMANLRKPLIAYRVRLGITQSRRENQLAATFKVAARNWSRMGMCGAMTQDEIRIHWEYFVEANARLPVDPDRWMVAARRFLKAYKTYAAATDDAAGLRLISARQALLLLRSTYRHGFPRGWAAAVWAAISEVPFAPMQIGIMGARRARELGARWRVKKRLRRLLSDLGCA